jgi:MerR family mercuric resistance operon transcriptional regulator
MTISELARRAGVGVETVRYYQRRGLFPEPPRQNRATREYSPEALALLRFIRRARGLGFTIREVERLVRLRRNKDDGRELATILGDKATELEQGLRQTERVIETLRSLATRVANPGTADRWQMFDDDDADVSG